MPDTADRAIAAREQSTADDDGGNSEELPADPLDGLTSAELRGQDHACHACHTSRDHIHKENRTIDRQTHKA